MGVTYIAPAGTYTAPAKLIEKTITENNTYNAIDDNANGYSSVTVNVGGGGGGGDFSTAEVTINFTFSEMLEDKQVWFNLTDIIADNKLYSNYETATQTVSEGETTTQYIAEMPLYKGVLANLIIPYAWYMVDDGDAMYNVNGTITVSGNATIDDGVATITGDCVVSIPVREEY